MAQRPRWLDSLLFGIRDIWYTVAGTPTQAPTRAALHFTGDVEVSDDAVNKRTVVHVPGSSAAVESVSAESPLENTGTATDPIISLTGSLVDAQHGELSGGALHADVVASGSSGFMTGADKAKLDGITAGAQPVTFATVSAALGTANAPVTFNGQALTGVTAIENSGSIEFDAQNGIYEYKRADNLCCTATYNHAGATTFEHVAGTTGISETWAQSTTGAGGTRSWEAQQGRGGDVGGRFLFVCGKGGVPGADLAGNFDVDLGQAVSNATAKARDLTNTAVMGQRSLAGGYWKLESLAAGAPQGLWFYSPNVLQLEAANAIGLQGNAVTVNATTGVLDYYVGANKRRTDRWLTAAGVEIEAVGSGAVVALTAEHLKHNAAVIGKVNTVSFSSTPTFTFTAAAIQRMTLTGNVTSMTFAGGVNDAEYEVQLIQDGTGGRTVVWAPSAFFPDNLGASPDQPGTDPNTMTIWKFRRYNTGMLCSSVAKNIKIP